MSNFLGNEFIWWQGVVEDCNDPLKLGRLRVRIFGYHTANKTVSGIPTNNLPWAFVVQPITSAAISGVGISPTGILPGTHVIGFFRDGLDAQQPVVFGTLGGIPLDKPVVNIGFCDPDGVYPKEDVLTEPDTNRLARNEKIEDTIVQEKRDSVTKDVSVAMDGIPWTEPETPYDAVYPKNHVHSSESGHIIEIDDTPTKERLHTYHKSGTFEEIHPDGTKVTRVVNDKYSVILGDDYINVRGDVRITVEGNGTVYVKQQANVQVDGNCNLYTMGDFTEQVDGDYTVYIKGNYNSYVEGTYRSESQENMRFDSPRIDLNP